MQSIIYWLENHLLSCPSKALIDIDCPGCGMQRSIIELMKGNLLNSLHLYPALLPVLFTMIFAGLHLVFKYKNGAVVIKYSFLSSSGIIFLNYLFKLANLDW